MRSPETPGTEEGWGRGGAQVSRHEASLQGPACGVVDYVACLLFSCPQQIPVCHLVCGVFSLRLSHTLITVTIYIGCPALLASWWSIFWLRETNFASFN